MNIEELKKLFREASTVEEGRDFARDMAKEMSAFDVDFHTSYQYAIGFYLAYSLLKDKIKEV